MEAARSAIVRLMREVSLEALPREVDAHADIWARIPAGTRIFLTRLPHAGFEDTVSAAAALRRRGLVPVPHVTARGTASVGSLKRTLARLRDEAGVDDILLVAGTMDPPAGPFPSTIELLETGILEQAGLRRIGVAGHPEGHPQAGDETLDRALERKNAFARDTGVELYLVTQFFFDAAPVIAWEKRIRARGNALPVHPGLHGVTGVPSLVRHAVRCGVGASLKMLTGRSGSLFGLASAHAPGRLLVDIARAVVADPGTLMSSSHVFPLGGFARTVEWAQAVRDGRFELTRQGDLLVSG